MSAPNLIRSIRESSEAGWSLIEVFVAIAVTIPLWATLGIEISRAAENYLRARKFHAVALCEERVISALQQGLHDLDSSRLVLPPRLHPGGNITFGDGTRNPIMDSPRAPRAGSDAITFAYLESGAQYRVVRPPAAVSGALAPDQPIGASFILDACPQYDKRINPDNHRSLVGVAVDQMRELKILGQRSHRRGGCVSLALRADKSMVVPAQEFEPVNNPSGTTFLVLIPIRDLYTLYVDANGTLRYLGHCGNENIENQPMSGGISELRVSMSEDPFHLTALTAEVSCHAHRPRSFSDSNLLSRSSPINILLNPAAAAGRYGK